MSRPTQEFELPESKKKVIMYTYLTRGERRRLTKKAMDSGLTTSGNVDEMTADGMFEIEDLQLEMAVETVDGEKPTVETFNEMQEVDAAFIKDKIDALVPKKKS